MDEGFAVYALREEVLLIKEEDFATHVIVIFDENNSVTEDKSVTYG